MGNKDAFVIRDEQGRPTFFLIGRLQTASNKPLSVLSQEAEIILFRIIDGFINGCLEDDEMMPRFSNFFLPIECLDELTEKLGVKASGQVEVILNVDVLAVTPLASEISLN